MADITDQPWCAKSEIPTQSYYSGAFVFFIHSGQEGQITPFSCNPGIGGGSSNTDKGLRDWLLMSC